MCLILFVALVIDRKPTKIIEVLKDFSNTPHSMPHLLLEKNETDIGINRIHAKFKNVKKVKNVRIVQKKLASLLAVTRPGSYGNFDILRFPHILKLTVNPLSFNRLGCILLF